MSLSRTMSRASKRGNRLMEQYQPASMVSQKLPRILLPYAEDPGKRKAAVRRHRMNKIARLSRRGNRV